MNTSHSIAALTLALSSTAFAQTQSPQSATLGGPPSPIALQYVQLQPTTPGTAQIGNANVNGVMIAGSFTGAGAAITNLNASSVASGTLSDSRLSSNVARLNTAQTFTGAKTFSTNVSFTAAGAAFTVGNTNKINSLNCDLLDGLDSSAFLQTIPVPLMLSSSSGTPIRGDTSADYYAAVIGNSTASNVGLGVLGYCGSGYGVSGYADNGTGVSGSAQISGWGVQAFSNSGDGLHAVSYGGGHAVYGNSYATDSSVYGVNNFGGNGVEGYSTQGSNGVTGRADSPYAVAAGVYGEHNGGFYGVAGRSTYGSQFGSDVGVWGETYGNAGWAMYSNGRFYVNGNFYAAGSKVGCVTDIVKNGGSEALETGDLVEIMGADAPVLGELPLIVVRKATSANATGVIGPIASAVNVIENRMQPPPDSNPDAKGHGPALPQFQIIDIEGAIAPGGWGHVVTLGSFKSVKVDASFGAVRPGSLLVASPNPGCAMVARSPEVGTVIGKSLGALAFGQGEVPLIVHQQ
jgi:hypothetical protein